MQIYIGVQADPSWDTEYPISVVELHIRFEMEIDTETRLISTRFGFPSGPNIHHFAHRTP